MRELAGKVAVVTGAGSGIGAAIARALAAEGMAVALADVELDAARRVAGELGGARALAIHCDVSNRESVEALARRVDSELAGCHLVCANAGVLVVGRLDRRTPEDWAWILGVNLMGTVHTVQAFLPLLRRESGERHVVVTSSMAGLLAAGPGKGAYNVTKHAQMAYAETLRAELAEEGIGVSLLLPAGTRTRIAESARNRPAALGTSTFSAADLETIARGVGETADDTVEPDEAIRHLVRGIRENAPWIVTHTTQRPLVERRFRDILAAFDRAE